MQIKMLLLNFRNYFNKVLNQRLSLKTDHHSISRQMKNKSNASSMSAPNVLLLMVICNACNTCLLWSSTGISLNTLLFLLYINDHSDWVSNQLQNSLSIAALRHLTILMSYKRIYASLHNVSMTVKCLSTPPNARYLGILLKKLANKTNCLSTTTKSSIPLTWPRILDCTTLNNGGCTESGDDI